MIRYFKVKGQSMEPLCREGDFLFLDTFSYLLFRPRLGDLVVLKHPQKDILLLKYVAKEQKEDERYLYWVEGLNKTESSDSRSFGWVRREVILGKAIMIRRKKFSTGDMLPSFRQ